MASIIQQRIAAWNAANPHAPIDPQAALAVATHEGLSGAIGDNGHAFGPWQLNNAGGVITGKFPGWAPEQINAWAWSPAGIDFALSHIGAVAGGLRGQQAVANIVSRFERPANIPGEIAASDASLGGNLFSGQTPVSVKGLAGAPMAQPPQTDMSPVLLALLTQPHLTPPAPVAPVFPTVAAAAAPTVTATAPPPVNAFRAPQLVFPSQGPSLLRPLA